MGEDVLGPQTEAFFRWLDSLPVIGWLTIAVLLDFLTGLWAGAVTKKLNSNYSYVGVSRKAGIYVVISVGLILQFAIKKMAAGVVIPTANAMAAGYLMSECISILENLGRGGVPLPKGLLQTLEKVRSVWQTAKPEPIVIREEKVTIIEPPAAHETKAERVEREDNEEQKP